MSIDNRNPSTGLRTGLKPGTRLVARYKGQQYSAQIVQTDKGLRYQLTDGRQFKSPSAAGSAIIGGTACNGWRFRTLAEEAAQARKPHGRPPVRAKKTARSRASTRTATFR